MTSCEAYSEVLSRMRERMALSGYAKSTIISYIRGVRDLMEALGKTPDKCTEEEVIAHLNDYRERKNMSPSALNTRVFGILYLYREVYKDQKIRLEIPNPGRGKSIGDILTQTELEALFAACHYPRQSAVLHLLYDTGLRAREVANLRLGDFDKKNAVLYVRYGKGGKHRVVPYGVAVLDALRTFYEVEKPTDYLFATVVGACPPEYHAAVPALRRHPAARHRHAVGHPARQEPQPDVRVQPKWEVSDVIGRFGAGLRTSGHINAWQKKVLTALAHCRTAALGGHVDACTYCGTMRISYNSCRDSNCPKCQSLERECWIMAREEELLPVVYYHAVFTLPADWNGLCLYNPRFVYDALFESAWETLQKFAADPKWLGAKGGATMVLHTWGQNLSLHPHVHAIVPGGGLAAAGQWTKTKGGGDKFLYPVKAMSKVFRAIFMKKVCGALETGLLVLPPGEAQFHNPATYRAWRNGLYQKPWVVYAKRPFGGPKQVIEYLGRYTHKTAISNHRILEVTDTQVRFAYKDYRAEGKHKEMTLAGEEFLRRFCLHIRPKGFRRMRHYGILSNAAKTKALAACRRSLRPNEPPRPKKDKKQLRQAALQRLWQGRDPERCPCCKVGQMLRIGLVPPQSLPRIYGARAPPPAMPHWTPLVN